MSDLIPPYNGAAMERFRQEILLSLGRKQLFLVMNPAVSVNKSAVSFHDSHILQLRNRGVTEIGGKREGGEVVVLGSRAWNLLSKLESTFSAL
jgi:hypothetical protein